MSDAPMIDPNEVDPLSHLAILHGTDKFVLHDYTPHYYSLLQHLRDRPLRMLEIGVGGYSDETRGGESLAMWRDFFPQAQITGLDIQRKIMDLGPRVKIVQGSQVDADCLAGLVSDRGPFDVILDDGSHQNAHVVETFGILFPTLVPGGIYIIEDVQTAFFPRFGGSLGMDAPNSVAMAADLFVDVLAGAGGEITAIERFHNIVVLHKRDHAAAAPRPEDDRYLALLRDRPDAVSRVPAHEVPDAEALSGLVAGRRDGDILVIEGTWSDPGLLRDLCAQIDHREIKVNFPDAPIPGFAARVGGFVAYPGTVLLLIEDNTYPSNFGFDPHHPRAAAAMRAMDAVIADPATTEAGLLRYISTCVQQRGGMIPREAMDRLEAMGSRQPRYILLLAKQLRDEGRWDDMERISREVLALYPDDVQIILMLSTAVRQQKRPLEALELLRDAYRRNPRARALVVALASLEVGHGNKAEGIRVMEGAITMFPAADRPLRLRQLLKMCQMAGDKPGEARVAQKLRDLVPDDPQAAEVLDAPAAATPQQQP